jgi:hypothetical protein
LAYEAAQLAKAGGKVNKEGGKEGGKGWDLIFQGSHLKDTTGKN